MYMNRPNVIIVLLLAISIIAGLFMYAQKESPQEEVLPTNESQASSTLPGMLPNSITDTLPNPPAGYERYTNNKYGFSLAYPKELSVKEFDEGGGAINVSFQNVSSGQGFQIFIVPYAEKTISKEQFLKDAPSGVRKGAKVIHLDGVPAESFYSEQSLLGETKEVWSLHGGYLYEITTYKDLDSWLLGILGGWKFIDTT